MVSSPLVFQFNDGTQAIQCLDPPAKPLFKLPLPPDLKHKLAFFSCTYQAAPNSTWSSYKDKYGTSSTNKHQTPPALRKFFQNFQGSSTQDPFPIDWHPGCKWFQEWSDISGTFLNPPYNSKPSPTTGVGALEIAEHLRKLKQPCVVLYKQGQNPVNQLSKEPWVCTVRIQQPLTYLQASGTPHNRPASFKSELLLLGFQKTTICLPDQETLLQGEWLDKVNISYLFRDTSKYMSNWFLACYVPRNE